MASSLSVLYGRKRGSEGLDNSPPRKILQYFYVLEEAESDISEEGTESINSIQDKSTDIARDTSDTSSKSENSDFESEYEVVSDDGIAQQNPFASDSFSSGTDTNIISAVAISALCPESDDIDVWADSSSLSSESDEPDRELSTADYWTCIQCKNTNNNPLFRYCEKCFKVRKNFFPPRPHGRKKRKARPKKKFSSKHTLDSGISCEGQKSLENDSIDSVPQFSTSGEQKLSALDIRTETQPSSTCGEEKLPDISTDCVAQSSKSVGNNSFYQEPLCSTCFVNPKNGIFVHGKWAHIYSCYKCSLKIWSETGRCPICKTKVSQVLKGVVAY